MKLDGNKLTQAFLSMTIMVATFTGAIANDDQYLNSDPIDISGYVKEAPVATDHELETVKNELRKQKGAIQVNKAKSKNYKKLSRSTEKLADATEEMIEERKESQEQIDKYNKKIDCLMAEGQKDGCEEYVKVKEDRVSSRQAAPAPVEQVVEVQAKTSEKNLIKILPYTGMKTFMSDNEQLEAGLTGGVRVESDVNSRFSIGLGFNYTSMTTTDYGTSGVASPYLGQYNSFYNGREIDYKNMNLDIFSKFFVTKNERFRPYIGAGLGYNRTTMEYTNNQAANIYNYNFGGEEVISSSINVELMLGSEIVFTESMGMSLEIQYARGLGSNLSKENGINNYQAPDQRRLESLSGELNEANIISVFAGLMVQF